MTSEGDNATEAGERVGGVTFAGAAVAFLLVVAVPLGVFLTAFLVVVVAGFIGFPASISVGLAVATPGLAPFFVIALLAQWRPANDFLRSTLRPLLGRKRPPSPSGAVIAAAAGAAVEHFGGDAGLAAAWAHEEGRRRLEAGDLHGNRIAARIMRAILARPDR
jgi:hypothetical protein